MGWKLNALLFLIALWALGAGALIVGVPLLFFLVYKFWSARGQSRPGTGRSHWTIYLGAFLLLLSLVAVAEQGTYSPVVFGLAGVALLFLGLFPGSVQGIVERIKELRRLWGTRTKERSSCVELTRIPLGYLNPEKTDPKDRLLKFERLTQTLAELGGAVDLRIEFSQGSGRVVFSAEGNDEMSTQGLLRVVRSQLPEFGAELATYQAPNLQFAVTVEGIPQPSVDPVGPLARYFAENLLDGAYSVVISPARVDPVSRWLAGRRQRKLAEGSGFQHIDDDRTTTVVDHPKQVELEESVKRLDRLLARRPVRVSAVVSAEDEVTAVHAANVLAGALSSQRRIDGLEVGRAGRRGFRRSTLMLPSEAAPYFWLPQASLGMKVAPSAEFHEPPMTEGEVVLGDAVGLSGRRGRQVRVPLDQLAKHVFITGMTGSGKTTSCFSLLLQLHRLRLPFLVVEPVKSEYRSLIAAIPELQVFTVGDENTAPFRLNIFEPPPGVKAQTHFENLVSAWNGSFVSYAPVPYVMERVFAEAYRACGWDLAGDTWGRPVGFGDVVAQTERVVRGLGYEPRVTMDVEAAIKVRLASLGMGGKERLFGGASSTPMEALLERPTVVELKGIQRDEEKAFVSALLLMNVASYVQARGGVGRLRHFTLIEEAHRLLPRVSTEKGDPEGADPRRMLVEQFGNMLAELRAYGEGLGVVEQIPTKVLPDAIKNTATKVVHRVPDYYDRRVMAGAMNATKEQAAVFTALRPGEAVVSVEGHSVPAKVEVEDVVAKLGVPVGEVSDLDVKRRMEDFYVRNPLPREPPQARDERIRALVDSIVFREAFLEAYKGWVRLGRAQALRDFLLWSAHGLECDPKEVAEVATRILALATAFYLPLDAEQRERFPRLFRKELEAAVRGG
jgi:hypothetical protein